MSGAPFCNPFEIGQAPIGGMAVPEVNVRKSSLLFVAPMDDGANLALPSGRLTGHSCGPLSKLNVVCSSL